MITTLLDFSKEDLHCILISALRYSIGARTYMPSVVRDFIVRNWDIIPDGTKQVIKRDLKEAIDGVTYFSGTSTLGDKCDEVMWRNLLRFMEDGHANNT